MNSEKLYAEAHEAHYSNKNLMGAYILYHLIIEKYPGSKEATYAKTQVCNIEADVQFDKVKFQESLINGYGKYKEEIQQQIKEEEQIKSQRYEFAKSFLYTTGYNFEKHEILSYAGIVTSEVVMGTGLFSEFSADISDFLGVTDNKFESKIDQAKQIALRKLKEKALLMQCNALIGVGFNVFSIRSNMIVVSANATGVLIKSISES